MRVIKLNLTDGYSMSSLLGILSGLIAVALIYSMGKIAKFFRFNWNTRLPKQEDLSESFDSLNKVFISKVKIESIKIFEPCLEHIGELHIDSGQLLRVSQIRAELSENEVHALIEDKSQLDGDPARISFRTCDDAAIKLIRQNGQKPKIISSGAVVVCSKRNSVLIYQRSQNSIDTRKDRLHVFCGPYLHETESWGGDKLSLRTTATREIYEETGIVAEIPAKYPAMISWEMKTGFFHLIYLGVDFAVSNLPKWDSDPEGSVIEIQFDELASILVSGKWVESSQMAILAWLKIGAPTTSGERFPSKKARQIYRTTMAALEGQSHRL